MGAYAPGTDLIDNPDCEIPQFDIGDTVGLVCEYANPRGLSFAGANRPVFDSTLRTQLPVGNFTISTTLAKFDRSGADPDEYIGPAITGYYGRIGGIKGSTTTGVRFLRIVQGGLPPGRYRFSFAVDGVSGVTIQEFHMAVAIKSQDIKTSWDAEGAAAYADTVLSWKWQAADVSMFPGTSTQWSDLPLVFTLPAYPPGDVFTNGQFGQEATEQTLIGRQWLTDVQWVFSLQLDYLNNTLSNPKLIYLGP